MNDSLLLLDALWNVKLLIHFRSMHVCVLSHIRLSVTSWTVTHQASLSMEFSRQEYWSRVSLPTPSDLPNPGSEPISPALAGEFCTTVYLGGSYFYLHIFM